MPNVDFNYFKPQGIDTLMENLKFIRSNQKSSKTFDTLFSNIATFSDKLKILLLKARLRGYTVKEDNSLDVTTIDYIKDYFLKK